MTVRPPTVFLARRGYRRRRLADALRLLPFLGLALLAVPLLWPDAAADADRLRLTTALIYVFGVWFLLIALAAILGWAIGRGGETPGAAPGPDGQTGEPGAQP